jgi:hypothetical protein
MREHVPTDINCAFSDIIEGQRKAMAQVAAEFSRPYRERIAELKKRLSEATAPETTTEHGLGSTLACYCPATSEYDPPCPRHGVLGIGVTGLD